MKNIHLLSTDKPSKIFYSGNNSELLFSKEPISFRTFERSPQNIYITSDEEIKEGVDQWYLDKVLNEPYNSGGAQYSSKQDVIIMTTDVDLIKDGVQAIDDKFLEWFVKNPSCEEVVVGYGFIKLTKTDNKGYWVSIPDEEFNMKKEEPKQETLKEVKPKDIQRIIASTDAQTASIEILQLFTQHQAKTMYSEEDIREAFRQGQDNMDYSDTYGWTSKLTEQEWFEQFKKK